jgi:membrane-associated phospholipid phosphatase
MSIEKSLGFVVNNTLDPNQINSLGYVPSWPQPLGEMSTVKPISGQMPLLITNLSQESASADIFANETSKNINPLINFSNSLLTRSPIDPWQFNLLTRDDSPAAAIDPVRQKITASVRQSQQIEPSAPDNFTIRAAGTVEIRGNSDLDGNPLILQDDALIYAGKGFSIKGNTILPVKRDINGNALRDSKGKLILVDRAVAVSSSYSLNEISSRDYGNLVSPQVVTKQQIDIPSYRSLEQQYLTSKITASNPQTTFNVTRSNISTTARWQQSFPVGGTISQPRVITVTGGDLNIPIGISLSNCIIIVQNGDIDLQNGTQQLDNVTLVTKNGDILLGNVRSKNLTVLSAGEISTGRNSKFDGNTLLTSKNGDISFRGATTNLNTNQNLQVIAHGEIDYRSNIATRGQFLSTGDFVANGNTNLYGTISSQKSVFLNGNTTITDVSIADVIPPSITVALSNDTGSNTIDRLTQDAGIKGRVTDAGGIAEFKFQLDGSATAIDLRSKLQADGTFNFTDAQVRQLVGNLPDGLHSLAFTSKDTTGNQSIFSLNFTSDTIAAAPGQLTLAAVSDSGINNSDRITNVKTPIITGTGEAGSILTLLDGTQQIGQTTVGTDGNWQIATAADLADGQHQLTATLTDLAGNTSSGSPVLALTIDSLAPQFTLGQPLDSRILNNNSRLQGTISDSQVVTASYSFDGGRTVVLPINASGNFDSFFDFTGIVDGVHQLTLAFTDMAGNSADRSYVINLSRGSLLTLALSNDSGPIGDGVTDAAKVNLIAKAAPGSTLTLAGWDKTGVADVTGQVVFENINLALGVNNFTVTKDGFQQQFSFQRVAPSNVVLEWNAIALNVMQRDTATPPPMFARNLAMVQAAVYDAVNAISQRYSVYKVNINAAVGTSEEAAAASAAARILSKLYPAQQAIISAALTQTLSTITGSAGKTAGIELGNNVADQIFAWRSDDGAKTLVSYQNSTEVGQWQPTLPSFGSPIYPQWPQVKPYALDTGSQFRPNGLPSLNSAEYTAVFNEVSQLGAKNSTLRTADQTQVAQFWLDGGGTYTPVGHWNQIAETVASVKGTSIIETARLFAQLDLALADAGIAAWDAKYTYNTWRPITAIRNAALDGNDNTTADPNWLPLINTPPFPEYVSGHSTFSAAAAAVLGKTFGDSFQFQNGAFALPGASPLPVVSRFFTSFSEAAAEAGQSRIYGGIHFQFANRDGLTLGKSIGDYVADRFLIDETKSTIQV